MSDDFDVDLVGLFKNNWNNSSGPSISGLHKHGGLVNTQANVMKCHSDTRLVDPCCHDCVLTIKYHHGV